ncbi:hypothetical protein Tco_1059304 [Tanacetum coccineum]
MGEVCCDCGVVIVVIVVLWIWWTVAVAFELLWRLCRCVDVVVVLVLLTVVVEPPIYCDCRKWWITEIAPLTYHLGDDIEIQFGRDEFCLRTGLSVLGITDDDENESCYKNEPDFTKPGSSFAFESYNKNEDEKNVCFDTVKENQQPVYHKWKKFMSFKPDIPETPLYKSKPIISKHYNKDSEVSIGNTFDNREALDLGVRLKALEEGYQFLSIRHIRIGDNPNLLFISDRHPAIALAVHNEFPLAFHGLPVTMLAETYRVMVQEWYFKRREVAGSSL